MSEVNKTVFVFRDHYKQSSDWFRHILGLFFDLNGTQLTTTKNPNSPLTVGAFWNFGIPQLVDAETSLMKQTVSFIPFNNAANRQYLQSLFNPSPDPAEQDYTLGTVDVVLKKTLSDNSKIYRDINIQTTKAQPRTTNSAEAIVWADTNSRYNFFIKEYEELIQKDIVAEEVLPNFYIFSLALDRSTLESISQRDYNAAQDIGTDSPYDSFMNKFDTFITLNNNILLNPKDVNFFFALVLVNYCQRYAEVYDSVSIDFLETMKNRFGSIFADITNQDIINRLNVFKDSYPMYIELLFSTSMQNSFLSFLEDSQLTLDSLVSFINDKILLERNAENDTVFANFQPYSTVESVESQVNEIQENYYTHDIESFIRSYVQELAAGKTEIQQNIVENSGNVTFLNISGASLEDRSLIEPVNINQFLSIITSIPRFNDLMKSSIRSYQDVINGKLAKSEVLYFRIEKRDKFGNIIQNFYIPNIPDVSVQSFVDTQVKYNKEYVYQIFAGTVIYGTEYYYQGDLYHEPVVILPADNNVEIIDGQTTNSQDNRGGSGPRPGVEPDAVEAVDSIEAAYEAQSSNAPVYNRSAPVKIGIPNQTANPAEQENFNIQTLANDAFVSSEISITEQVENPVSEYFLPEYTFDVYYKPALFLVEVEYSDNLTGLVVDYPPTPPIVEFKPIQDCQKNFYISFSPSVGTIKMAPTIIKESDNIYFAKILEQQKSDRLVTFRYQGDVANYEMYRLDYEPSSYEDFAKAKFLNLTGTENFLYRETVEPNKTYYYTFRARDFHNGISNPSPIYEVKLYVNNGIENLDVKIFTFKTPKPIKTKYFKKYLKIVPNLLQTTYSYFDDKLGLMNESVYDQEFLLRVKSKHSGKVMDVIIKFNKENRI